MRGQQGAAERGHLLLRLALARKSWRAAAPLSSLAVLGVRS